MIIINIKERNANIKDINRLSKQYDISKDIVSFLLGRGVSEATIPLLVSKDELTLYNNDSLTNVREAAELINRYLEDNTATIYIYGDYDSDGVNATYIMYNALVELAEAIESTVTIQYYLPNREEGYGLSLEWCQTIKDTSNALVITVDNGIAKRAEVTYLTEHGIEVLVTDHHQPQVSFVPECLIVDAHYHNDDINAKGLCGAAVAYKIIAYLYQDMYEYDFLYVKKYIAHVGIATITDMMPFTDENIIFVSNTLKYLNDYPYTNEEFAPVTESIYYYAELNKGANIKAKDIAFGLGPQINSCGRMGDIQLAMNFMLADDEDAFADLYKAIDDLNETRKNKTKILTADISAPKTTDLSLVVKLKDVEGIAGSIASNLCDKYGMPVIVFSEGKGVISGSARAPEGFNLQTLFTTTEHVVSFGGHECAAGISIQSKDYAKFKKAFNKTISKTPVSIASIGDTTIYVDKIISGSDINRYTINQYDNVLFFNEFTRPVYGLKNIQITGYHTSKNNPNNICFHIKNKNKEVKLWCWGFGNTYKALGEPQLVDIVGTLEIFNGMYVVDIHNIEAV